MKDLEYCRVLVTGASRGIGKQISLDFSEKKAHLILTGTKSSTLEKIKSECLAKGASSVQMVVVDFLTDSLDPVASACKEGLDIFVCNAGIYKPGLLCTGSSDTKEKRIYETIKVNLTIPMVLSSLISPIIIKSQKIRERSHLENIGALIFINSTSTFWPSPQESAYVASKAGLLGFSDSIFPELREKGIKVCSIHPSYVKTDITSDMCKYGGLDSKKILTPKDVSDSVLWACSTSNTCCPSMIKLETQKTP
ncbi:Short-chain dehydrogenase/reductase SDR like protein [Aduncisulcus paluster]|uniref:Short-chain dehydrogenase/reductase SDR like protein n=1 Tax=Aduncisulcus paluster TaxID=2918883 RepID=A0ABQ5KD96_9EUKA|nr:Short-chain dehydrogenase/reductase SDR like protein [Aduncisulcus paluster]